MTKRLFVGNLSFDVSEQELQDAFTDFGSSGATIPRNDNGKPKGFGFVDVEDEKSADAIAQLDGKELSGRAIAVSEAKPRADLFSGQRRGEGGRGGGGGGRGRSDGGNRGGGGGGGNRGGSRW